MLEHLFEVKVGRHIRSVVLADQVKSLDWRACAVNERINSLEERVLSLETRRPPL
jgi:mRNA-degrading endonuclease toxin of MazEF toxin-antitoxin module